jgi:hypothetical protein
MCCELAAKPHHTEIVGRGGAQIPALCRFCTRLTRILAAIKRLLKVSAPLITNNDRYFCTGNFGAGTVVHKGFFTVP